MLIHQGSSQVYASVVILLIRDSLIFDINFCCLSNTCYVALYACYNCPHTCSAESSQRSWNKTLMGTLYNLQSLNQLKNILLFLMVVATFLARQWTDHRSAISDQRKCHGRSSVTNHRSVKNGTNHRSLTDQQTYRSQYLPRNSQCSRSSQCPRNGQCARNSQCPRISQGPKNS